MTTTMPNRISGRRPDAAPAQSRRYGWAIHLGLLAAVVGAFLPWTTVATRSRSGFSTAEVLLSVASAGAPEGFFALGLTWYLAAATTVAAWVFGTIGVSNPAHRLAMLLSSAAILGWIGFGVWAWTDNRLDIDGGGWFLTTLGSGVLAVTIWRKRT